MNKTAKPRSVIGTFFKDAHGRLSLDSLEVISATGGRKYYDVDFSRSYGYIFHMSGASGRDETSEVGGIYAVSGEPRVTEVPSQLADETARQRNRTRRLRRLPSAFDLEPTHDLFDWLVANAIEQDAVWCSKCRDWLPGETLCAHTWWCNKTGWYSTLPEGMGR